MIKFENQDEYYTPKYIIDYFFPEGLDYDPATNIQKAIEFNIKNYDTIETDGLTKDWSKYKRIWINPPFTLKYEFLQKAVETYNLDNSISIYILLPIMCLTTNKFFEIEAKGKLFIPKGRIIFTNGKTKKEQKSPAFGCVILKLENENSIEYIEIKEGDNNVNSI